ncbi:glycine-rich domain-containing protein [Gordonia sputi]|uniref:glycine-rich domain-containing protein n=1 Tax=Gordonia sputi TaxID=36823 RepID=UPI0036A50E16
MGAIEDWYDEPALDTSSQVDGEFYDPPQERLDMSRVPPKNAGLPIDVDLAQILAGSDGFASKPDAKDIATLVVSDIRGFVNAVLAVLESGDPSQLVTWLTTTSSDWLDEFNDWTLGISANFADLLAVFQGTYTGDDAALIAIQSVVSTLRGGLTGLIDWSRIPQLSLSQLTNQPGPNMLSGFGDFASADTMDAGSDWTWDASVGGGSARATLSGARKVLTSELVAVAEGQALAVSGKARKNAATGSGQVAKLVVLPFVGDAAQAEVVIGGVGSGSDSAGTVVSGSWTVPASVTGVRVRVTVEAAGTSGTVWWDDVSLRKTATSLPQQWIGGLVDALGDLGDDIGDALAKLKEFIEKLTGQARSSVQDAINDAVTFAAQVKSLLSGGTVSSPFPNLVSAIGLGQNQIAGLVGSLAEKATTTMVAGAQSFILNLANAILSAIRKVPVAGGAIADRIQEVLDEMSGLKNQADATKQVVATGSDGQVVSQGVLDGLTYQLSVFTSNGTFTPPTPPSGYELAYYIGTVYGGGESGSKLGTGDTGGQNAPGGRNGGRASRRLSVAEVGSGVSITVGAGGASKTSQGKGNPGGSSYIGPSGAPLLVSTARTSSIATSFGDLPSSSIPGNGGYGAQLRYVSSSDYTVYPGEDGYPSSKANGGDGGTSGSTWWGGTTTTPPTSGTDGTISGDHSSGGGGGGGGGSRVGGGNAPQHGAPGGAPGSGGGGGGGHTNNSGNGGAGGRGQVDILTVFKAA